MKQKSIAVNTILNSVRMTLTILIPLITYPYITRIFSADGIGQYEWVKSVVSIFSLIASMGITTYAIREGSKYREDRVKFTKFAQELFILNLISTVVCYLVLFVLICAVPKFSEYKVYLLIYSVNIGLSALCLDWVYGVYEDYAYITVRQIIVQVVSVCGLFLLVRTKNDLIIYIIITTVSNSGANIFNFIRARKYADFKPVGNYNLLLHLAPVLIFFGTRFAMNAYNSLDSFILGMMCSDESVGYYNVAVKVNTIIVTFFIAMSPVYLPRMIKYITEKNSAALNSLLNKVIRLKTILIYPMIGGLFCLAPQVVWILAGDGYDESVLTLRLLCFVLGFVILSSIVQKDVLIPKGREKAVLVLTVVAAVSNVLISSILIIFVGFNGAAIGSLIAEGIVFISGVLYVKKIEKINLFLIIFRESYKYIFATLIMIFVCFLMSCFIHNNLLLIVTSIPVAAVIYFLCLLVLRDYFLITNTSAFLRKLFGKKQKKMGD